MIGLANVDRFAESPGSGTARLLQVTERESEVTPLRPFPVTIRPNRKNRHAPVLAGVEKLIRRFCQCIGSLGCNGSGHVQRSGRVLFEKISKLVDFRQTLEPRASVDHARDQDILRAELAYEHREWVARNTCLFHRPAASVTARAEHDKRPRMQRDLRFVEQQDGVSLAFGEQGNQPEATNCTCPSEVPDAKIGWRRPFS